jgi:hypothetical protein
MAAPFRQEGRDHGARIGDGRDVRRIPERNPPDSDKGNVGAPRRNRGFTEPGEAHDGVGSLFETVGKTGP